jgi:hypothetical protein
MSYEVQIDTKPVKTVETSDIYNLVKKTASESDLLPKYLYIVNEDTNSVTSPVVMHYIFDSIVDVLDFNDLLEKEREGISRQNLDIKEDVLKPFVVFNKTFENFKESEDELDVLFSLLSEDVKQDLFYNDANAAFRYIKDVWDNRESIKGEYRKEIEDNRTNLSEAETYDTLPEVEHTEFIVESINFDLVLDTCLDIEEIFNRIVLNSTVPFARMNQFYKVLNDFVPKAEWSEDVDNQSNVIVIKSLEASDEIMQGDVVFNNNFNTSTIFKKQDGTIVINMTLQITRDFSQEKYVSRVLSVFEEDVPRYVIAESRVSGVFFLINQTLDVNVFREMTMNDPVFSNLLVTNESRSVKDNGNVYVYYKLNETDIPLVKANLTFRLASKSDVIEIKNAKKDAKIGDSVVRVKVTYAKDMATANEFISALSKIFTRYNRNYSEVVDYYRQFVPTFGTQNFETSLSSNLRNQRLKDVAPEIFQGRYSRLCPNLPTIVTEEQALEYEREGYQVMDFPRADSGFPVRKYVCLYEEHIYPGLRLNRDNADIPFLPCCYKNDQRLDENSKYNNYFMDTEAKVKGMQQDFITTKKYAQYGALGALPENLVKMFRVVDSDCVRPRCMYVRRGVYGQKNSFLQCVLDAVNLMPSTDLRKTERKLVKIRKEQLSKASFAAASKQELYDKDISEIIRMTADENLYLDPKLFIHMLETAYNCRIYIFHRPKNSLNGELIIPRHIEGYYRETSDKKNIFIFEHFGSESDNSSEPRCELIVKVEKTDRVVVDEPSNSMTMAFDYDSSVAKGINGIFKRLNRSYILNKEVEEIYFPININDVVSQQIDTCGKTRCLNIRYKEEVFSLFSSPIQPYNIKLSKNKPRKVDINKWKKFVRRIGMVVEEIEEDKVSGKIGNVDVFFLLKRTDEEEKVTKSVLSSYNKNKRIARYLTEFMFWAFSNFLNEEYDVSENIVLNDIMEVKDSIIISFVEKRIILDRYFKYDDSSLTFKNNSGFMVGDKLIVTSEEMLKRLVYALELEITRNYKGVVEYKDKQYIPNYYEDVTDFTSYPNQVLLYGNDSIKKWIDDKEEDQILFNEVNIDYPALIASKNVCYENFTKKPWLTISIKEKEYTPEVLSTWISFEDKSYDKVKDFVLDEEQNISRLQIINLEEDESYDDEQIWRKANEEFINLLCSNQYTQKQNENVLTLEDKSGAKFRVKVIDEIKPISDSPNSEYVLQTDNIFEKQQEYLYSNDNSLNEIQKNKDKPYFFRNRKISDQIFLAQNVNTFEEALTCGNIWINEGYNSYSNFGVMTERKMMSNRVMSNRDVGYKLYKYINADMIYLVRSNKAYISFINILGYKINGNTYYTVLLPLN